MREGCNIMSEGGRIITFVTFGVPYGHHSPGPSGYKFS